MDNFESHSPERKDEPNAYCGQEGVYSGNFWYPEFVPVRGIYNDYGSVEKLDVKSLNWSYVEESINSRVVEYKLGPNEYHDPAVTKGMLVEDLLNVLQEGRLRFKYSYQQNIVPVCQTMIREDVYQSLLSISLEETWWVEKDADKYSPESIYKHGLELFTKPGKNTYFDFGGVPHSEDIEDMLLFHDDHDFKNYFVAGLHSNEGESGLKPYRSWITKALNSGKIKKNSVEFKALLEDLADFIYIKSVHSNLRLGWHPGIGQGSQSSNFSMAKQFHRNIANIAIQARKKYNDR